MNTVWEAFSDERGDLLRRLASGMLSGRILTDAAQLEILDALEDVVEEPTLPGAGILGFVDGTARLETLGDRLGEGARLSLPGATDLPSRSSVLNALENALLHLAAFSRTPAVSNRSAGEEAPLDQPETLSILNAHFLPGWPPLIPIQDSELRRAVSDAQREGIITKTDAEMLTYLANFGLSGQQVRCLLAPSLKPRQRFQFLARLMVYAAAIAAAMRTVAEEIQLVSEELALENGKAALKVAGGRHRLNLR